MKIEKININYQDNCINVDKDNLMINWNCDEKQKGYYLNISEKTNTEKKLYEVEIDNSSENIIYINDLKLEAETSYVVLVKIKGETQTVEKTVEFRTGNFGKFNGKWISDGKKLENEIDYYKGRRNCVLRKKFTVDEINDEAFLYIVGLGYYNVYINGNKVGKAELNTDWTNYARSIFYDVYNVKEHIVKGENEIFVELGNGWYNPSPLKLFAKYNLRNALTIGEPKLLADLKLKSKNNETIISTDDTWEVAGGPYLFNNIYLGETIDFRLFKDINAPFDFLDTNWEPAVYVNSPGGKFEAGYINKVEQGKVISAKEIILNEKGNVLIDFEETVEGFIDIIFKGKSGQEVVLKYGENLYEDKTINPDTILAGLVGKFVKEDLQVPGGEGAPTLAEQIDTVILTDESVRYVNKFTYHSFRYVEIEGINIENISDAKAIYVHTKLDESGSFECSDEFLNRLFEVAGNTKKNNTRAVFEDCARERLGYGGDVVALADSQIFMYDTETFYEKIIKDFRNDIRENGGVPEIAPFMGIQSNGTGDGAGPLGWQLVYTNSINKIYQYYGNERVIEEEYEYLAKQLDYLASIDIEQLEKCCLGDWGSREVTNLHDYKNNSPARNFTSACFYYYHILLMEKYSRILNYEKNIEKYSKLAEETKQMIIDRYRNEDGTYSDKTQTSYVFAIYFDLEEDSKKLFDLLVENIIQSDYDIKSGIFGMNMVYELLARYNRSDLIYKWLKSEKAFGYLQGNDKSVLREFIGDNPNYSDNHGMFSSYVQWFFQGLGGINVAKDAVACDKIVIKPYFEPEISYVNCSFDSVKGKISSNWVKNNSDEIELSVEKPADIECILEIEKKYEKSLSDYKLVKEENGYLYYDISNEKNISLKLV